MELYFLDRDFRRMTNPIDAVRSVVWNLRYFECGTFRVIFPAEAELLDAARRACYLCTSAEGSEEVRCGRIEYIGYTGTDEIELGGRMLECLLSDRVMLTPWSMTGSVSEVALSAVTSNLRGISLTVGADSAEIAETVTGSADWEALSDWLYAFLRPYGASYTLTLDAERQVPVLRIVYPSPSASVVFSSSFENIAEVTYEAHSASMKNVAYIEGNDGTVQSVDLSDGGERREVFRRAASIRPGAFDTAAAYHAALRAKGRTVLGEPAAEEYISCTATRDALPVFGVDYRLGDLCYVDDAETGISMETRVTEADEVWENGTKTVYPAFGGRLPGIKHRMNLG